MQKPGLMTVLVLLLLLAPACKPLALRWTEPDGPPEFVLGYRHGCDAGYAVTAGLIPMMFYSTQQDPSMRNNKLYNIGWHEGYAFCKDYGVSKDFLTGGELVGPP